MTAIGTGLNYQFTSRLSMNFSYEFAYYGNPDMKHDGVSVGNPLHPFQDDTQVTSDISGQYTNTNQFFAIQLNYDL
ncbi:hypothetical protein [Vibrio sp. SS-MA-C1-2]|uniref:hypothetical protein n=1 Tax=Vibrio sp. SS-MA-C1-2 TaxID=2908646 RepID=UPI0038FBF9E9